MAFTLDDLIQSLGESETFSTKLPSLDEEWNLDQVKKYFPDVAFTVSEAITYMPVRMCHSLPTINARRRCFTAQTMANSFATARHNMVNLDHQLLDNGVGKRDIVIGHILASAFDPEQIIRGSELSSGNLIPSKPAPVIALCALFNRCQAVKDLVDEHQKKRNWQVSMECGHRWNDAAFLYRGEVIPFKDAPAGMLECVKSHTILDYKNHEVAAIIGGVNGTVDYWGMAMTRHPADSNSNVLAMFSARPKELASKESFATPIRLREFKSSEAANVDIASDLMSKRVRELSNAPVIGYTQNPEGGVVSNHTHRVLADGTILPAEGHSHYLADWQVLQGSKASFLGRTDFHRFYTGSRDLGTYREVEHLHMVDIPLTKKFAEGDDDPSYEYSSILNLELPKDIEMNLLDTIKKLEETVSRGNAAEIAKEVASLKDTFKEENQAKEIASKVNEAIEARIAKGEIFTKEKLDAEIANAVKAEKDAAAAREKEIQKRADRIQALSKSGIELASKVVDGEDQTVEQYVGEIACDAAGDREFDRFVKLKSAVKAAAPATGGKPVVVPGGGPQGGAAPAKEQASGQEAKNSAKENKVGRYAFSNP